MKIKLYMNTNIDDNFARWICFFYYYVLTLRFTDFDFSKYILFLNHQHISL